MAISYEKLWRILIDKEMTSVELREKPYDRLAKERNSKSQHAQDGQAVAEEV